MKITIFKTVIILIVILSSCIRLKNENDLRKVLLDYAEQFPINVKNYNYVIRFYLQNNDTILELSQDRIDVDYPIDFLFNQRDTNLNTVSKKRFVRVGKVLINEDEFFIFDTHDSIGKIYYEKLSIKQVEDKIEEVNVFNYPYLPVARIYKQKEGKLLLIKERDTIRFK